MEYKQGYKDRMDESMGMRNGRGTSMKQSYKDRRDESYGMKGVMGHEKKPSKCNPFAAQKSDMGRLQEKSSHYRGNSDKAYGYKY